MHLQDFSPDHSTERVVPDGTVFLIFELDGMPRFVLDNETFEEQQKHTRCWISGMQLDYITIQALQNSEMFVIQFKAHGLYPFIRQSVDLLNDKVQSPEPFFGEGIFDFRLQLLEAKESEDKFRLAEEWLAGLFSEAHLPRTEVIEVVQKIQSNPGLEFNSIRNLISETGISQKHFTELFRRYVGLTPKQYQRVLRFNEILAAIHKQEKVDWTQIALGCGYFDQSHFIREFKRFCGINPSDFMVNYKDFATTNFFPLD
jgi:AraC-like DNA-binding protein